MTPRDIHEPYDFFEYVRLEDSLPPADPSMIDVALLDMNHSWPNLGHDAIVHAVLEAAEDLRDDLVARGRKVRVLSFDIRRRMLIPPSPGERFSIYIGTGGPGHLDPRENDGVKEFSQGIAEDPAWEAPLFSLFDDILANDQASLFAICHTFGLVCRWSGIAHPELRAEKSSGMPTNVLTDDGAAHPWFSRFAAELDGREFRVLDNRLFDLAWDGGRNAVPIAMEGPGSHALTMVQLAADSDGMPRFLGVNHHPEIIDREHIMVVLDEKREHHEVSDQWYRERVVTMRDLFQGENERQSRLTSRYTFVEPLRHQLRKAVER